MDLNFVYVANIETICKKEWLFNKLINLHVNVAKYDAYLYLLKDKTFVDIETGKIYKTKHRCKVGDTFVNLASLKDLNTHLGIDLPQSMSRKKILETKKVC